MRQLLLVAFLLVQSVLSSTVSAAPCASAPLATYATSGFSCTIGTLDFSGFSVLAGPTVASPFAAVNISPVTTGPSEFGLAFAVNQIASPGQLFEQLISYRVTGIGNSINGNTLLFSGSSTTEDAVVTALEQKCLGGAFLGADGVTGCTGSELPFPPLLVNILGVADPPVVTDFAGVAFLTVVSDIAVDGGALGTAELTSATNLFRVTAAPGLVDEPSPVALVALAGLLLLLVGRRKASSCTSLPACLR